MYIGSLNDANSTLLTIMDAESQVARDSQKSASLKRQLHHDKKIQASDNSLTQMHKQQSQLKSAASKGFVFGVIKNAIQMVTNVLSTVLPMFAPVIQLVGQGLMAIVNIVSEKMVSKNQMNAQDAQIKSESYKQQADVQAKLSNMAEEDMQNTKQSKQQIQSRLESALNNLQQAQNVAVRA